MRIFFQAICEYREVESSIRDKKDNMVSQAIATQIWLGLSLNSPPNLGGSQSSRRAGPMLWDLDQQFPGSIGGSQPASECGFPPFRFWRKKLESGPTDRPTAAVCTHKGRGEGGADRVLSVKVSNCSFQSRECSSRGKAKKTKISWR